MIIINSQQLQSTALTDENHPLHSQAKEYEAGVKYLKKTYGEKIKFVRPGFPKRGSGFDSRGNSVPNLAEPTPPMLMPLRAEIDGKTGMEIWEISQGTPKLLPNGLWEATGRRSKSVTEHIIFNLKDEAELAFFFYYKSPFMSSGLLKIDDPAAEARIEGDKARAELELQSALYHVLSDEEQLKVIAQAYGIEGTDRKHPDSIRKELRGVVLSGETRKRSDPSARGVKEFLDELKVTDAVRMRSLITVAMDNKQIQWYPEGKFKVADRDICKVPQADHPRKYDYLCQHLLNPANRPKLQDLLRDIVTKEYLDKVADEKTFSWIGRVMELNTSFKKSEEVRELVYGVFVTV
jgi:hypothetical protein